MNSTALNLEAIDTALRQHADGRCPGEIVAILMSPFEVERLGFDDFLGVPIEPDEEMGTGRFRLVCDVENAPEEASVVSIETGQPLETTPVEPLAA